MMEEAEEEKTKKIEIEILSKEDEEYLDEFDSLNKAYEIRLSELESRAGKSTFDYGTEMDALNHWYDEEKQRMHDNRRRKEGASSLKIALENSIANIKDAIKIPDSSAQDDDFDVIDISQKK